MRGHKIITWSTPKQVQMRERQRLTDPVNRHPGQTRNSARWCKKAKGSHVYTKGFWEYTHLGDRHIRSPWVINYCGRCGYRKIWYQSDLLSSRADDAHPDSATARLLRDVGLEGYEQDV